MIADFGWTCANYVYTSLDIFSSSAYQTFKSIAHEKNIRLASSVDLKLKPTTGEYYDAITKIMKSGCLATVIVTQSAQAAEVIYEAHRQGYEGHFVTQGSGMSVPDYLHRKTGNEIQVNRMMKGIFAVDSFNGAGTKRSAFMNLNTSMSGVRMRSTPPISITTADIKTWRVFGGNKHPRQR